MKTLTELEMTECRWPLDDTLNGKHIFCAAPKKGGGSPYCARHHAMAYTRAPKRLPAASGAPMMLEYIDPEFDGAAA